MVPAPRAACWAFAADLPRYIDFIQSLADEGDIDAVAVRRKVIGFYESEE